MKKIQNLPFQKMHNGIGCIGIEACCWFIQEQDTWQSYQFHSDIGTLPFSTRYATDKFSTNLGIKTIKGTEDHRQQTKINKIAELMLEYRTVSIIRSKN